MSQISMTDVLSEMASKVEGMRLLAVVDSDSMVLAYWQSSENDLSPDALGEFIQQVKHAMSTFRPSSEGSSKLNNMVLGTSMGYMMLKPICNGNCFIVADTPRNASLGSIRAAFTSFTARLEQTIPGYELVAS